MLSYLIFALECESQGDTRKATYWADKYIADTFLACFKPDPIETICAGKPAPVFAKWEFPMREFPWSESKTFNVPATCREYPRRTCSDSEWCF